MAPRPAEINRRIGFVFLAFLLLLCVAVFRAAWLGAIQAGSLQSAASKEQMTVTLVPSARGTITDRNGVELAISEAADDVTADPYLIKDPQAVARALAPLLGQPQLKLLSLLTKQTGFVYLAHMVPAAQADAALKLRLNHRPIDGINLIPQMRRVYPRAWAASQVLGGVAVKNDGAHQMGFGYAGVELEYNTVLRGIDGVRREVSDAKGQPIAVNDAHTAVGGQTLQLTIDSALQDEVEQVLAGVGATYRPKSATAIVMDPNTGEILALANWPRVNANDPTGAPTWAKADRAVGFTYEPGSTFKSITVAGALQDGVVTPDTQIYVPWALQLYDRTIHDAESHPSESLTVAHILSYSSNIGADKIGMMLGKRRFDYWVRQFGFGSRTGIDLPGEERGIVLHWWQYSGSSMGNLPMGQGESVTPIQMAAAYSVIANGGILRSPRLIKAIGGKPTKLPAGRRVISPYAAYEMRTMLRGVLADGGTASGAAIPGYDMAGKTGTANEVINGQYSKSAYAASFIGMVPATAPKLVVAVLVDQPQGAIYGGAVAAPAFQKIVGWAVPYLGISPR